MNKEEIVKYFNNKVYKVPFNVPNSRLHTYVEILEKGYGKYLDIINSIDGFMMFQQFYDLVKLLDGQNRTEQSNITIAQRIIKKLKKLNFIDTHYINQNKFIYLRRPGGAVATGDYNNYKRVNITKDLKNQKFKTAIMKAEYFIKTGEILNSDNMINQLKKITEEILIRIENSNNKYGYDVDLIKKILKLNDYLDIRDLLDEYPEFTSKLDIVRGLWEDLGNFYRKLMLQRQTVTSTPEYLEYFITEEGKVILHYIPNIVIFDIGHDNNYYREKVLKLFNAFYNINGNELRNVQKDYISSNKKSMGYRGSHHIGYRLLLLGAEYNLLKERKAIVDEDFNKSITSPLMDVAEIITLDIGKYLYHVSRRGNKFSKEHNRRIDRIIFKKLNQLKLIKNNSENTEQQSTKIQTEVIKEPTKTAGEEIFELLEG